jgi:very-short-patch-repair endonuclease
VVEKTDNKFENGSVVWKCLCECGNITYASYTDLSRYRKTSCGCSNYSNMENFIANILSENQINYIPQARFSACRNIYPLPFDFYLYDYNTIIEYDGEQHFYPVEYFGGEDSFEKIVRNDILKNDYCLKHGINLIRLPYTLTTEDIKQQLIHIWNP